MTSALANITFDCSDAAALAGFWSAVLDRPVDPDGSVHFASIGMGDATAPSWLFSGVPEGKTAKNRMHVDLAAPDRDAEVARLVGLGASHLQDVAEHGHSWAVLRDPEGNEFCVAQQPAA